MTLPSFTIITISYNHAEFIEDTIRSVMEQGYPNVQHIIVDGGSTDGTLEILKRYPHLEWTSEPDRGICHALNKGLAKARGDIVAWLNSDDWYAPGCFSAVAQAIKRNPIVMGDAIETDRAKNPVRTIQNFPRTYHDIARYWVPYAWLAQPSVFFTKELLHKARLPNGDFMDESFQYSMDAEFWLRIGEYASFTEHVPQVLSHFRVYGENKTGRTFAAPRKELGRAFRKSYSRLGQCERQLSIVLPIKQVTRELTSSMEALLDQSFKDFELFIVDYSANAETQRSIREMVLEMEEHTLFGIKYLRAETLSFIGAWNTGLKAARSPLIGFMSEGDKPAQNCFLDVLNVFVHDPFGAALPLQDFEDHQQRLRDGSTGNLNLNELVSSTGIFSTFFARTLALQDLGGFTEARFSDACVKDAIFKLMTRGWGISYVNPITVAHHDAPNTLSSEIYRMFRPYEQAYLTLAVSDATESDIFYPVRLSSGGVPAFSEQQRAWAKKLLALAPHNFLNLDWLNDPAATTRAYPEFAPAWLALAERSAQEAKNELALSALAQCKACAQNLARLT